MNKKKCWACNTDKELSEFARHSGKKDGLQSQCRECHYKNRMRYSRDTLNKMQREYRKEHKDEVNQWRRNDKVQNPEKYLFYAAKTRATKAGLEFTLSLDDIKIPEKCPYLGIPLMPGSASVSPNSPSLDRIDPQLGYTPGNTIVCSHRANGIKRDASSEELLKIGLALTTLQKRTKNELQH